MRRDRSERDDPHGGAYSNDDALLAHAWDSSRVGVPHEKIVGLAAARAVMETRPEDVLRIAHSRTVRAQIGELLRQAAARRIAYEERSDDDLAKIAGSVHHEGISIAARPRRLLSVEALLGALRDGKCRAVLALDDIGNPHNAGALVRTAAFFGIDAVLLEVPPGEPPLSTAAIRVAQGGAEHVHFVRAGQLAPALSRIAQLGVAVVGTDVRASRSLAELRWPARAVIVVGSEGAGMREASRRACTELVAIPGRGAVESLNVSVAAGVVLASWAARA